MRDSKDLGDRVRRPGLRIIWQRAIILQALYKLNDKVSVDQVYDQEIQCRSDVDPSTVHHTLETLEELGIVCRTDQDHACAAYEIVGKQPGHHLICCQCGCIIGVADDYVLPVAETIRQDFGFEPTSTQFAVLGICQACRGELLHD